MSWKKIGFICLVVWLFVIYFVFFHARIQIDRDEVLFKEGISSSAKCENTRTTRGISFYVSYEEGDSVQRDFIFLPVGVPCSNELIIEFEGGVVKISYYKNIYLGYRIGGVVIQTTEEGIEFERVMVKVLDRFIIFVACVVTIFLLLHRHGSRRRRLNILNDSRKQKIWFFVAG